jgi:SET domain-containing protein
MAQNQSPHYMSTSVALRSCPEKGGYGVYARKAIKAGELLMVWGGEVVTEEQLEDIPVERSTHGLQVDDGVYILPTLENDPADFVNHSCSPNAGMRGQISLVAMTDIQPDDEICFDYAMTDSSDYDEFECRCGTPDCRKRVTGNDWKIPELHQKYAGFFSTYLERKITGLYQQKTLAHQPPIWVKMRVAMYR